MDDIILNRLNEFHPTRQKCMYCGGEIWYNNARISGVGKITGTSFNSSKTIGEHTYKLCVCEECFHKEYPETKPSFCVCCKPTKFAFNICDEDFEKARLRYSNKEEYWIEKYGEEIGKKRWKEYCRRQAETNTFEYKQKKYGWTKDQFDEYNKSRAVTKDNLIKRHGLELGLEMWNKYVKSQKTTKSREYVIEKYGEETWIKMCESKKNSLNNFIMKYGELGVEKYKKFISRSKVYYSNMSQEFFREIDTVFSKKYTTYFATKNGEFGKLLNDGYVKLDYYISELNLCIEFNGDQFHGNPNIYNEDEHCSPYNKSITAGELIEKDNARYKELEEMHGIKTIVVWESDYKNGIDIDEFTEEILKKYGEN